MSVTCEYPAEAMDAYAISLDLAGTVVQAADLSPLPFDPDFGSLTVGWYIPGDVNGDCTVNILDLLAVRNHLRQDPDSGDNWRADVKSDGSINVLDMIFVRGKLRTVCDE